MSARTATKTRTKAWSLVEKACLAGMTVVGLILIFYYGTEIMSGQSESTPEGVALYAIAVGLLALVSALGYWQRADWAWPVIVITTLSSLAFPGTLFEFKADARHLVAWVSTILLILMAIALGVSRSRKPKPSNAKNSAH